MSYAGIDYGRGRTNIDVETSIRYGVINQNVLGQAWYDASEAVYPETVEAECACGASYEGRVGDEVECLSCGETQEVEYPSGVELEPEGFRLPDGGDIEAFCFGEDGDIFVTKSPYFTYAEFCSPCAPGACYLTNPLDEPVQNNRAYCFGHELFWDTDEKRAPYPVYSVATGELVEPKPEKEASHAAR